MNILILSHMYPNKSNVVTGVFVHDQAKALLQRGHKVKVISTIPWSPFPLNLLKSRWKTYSQVPIRENYDGIDVCYLRVVNYPRLLFFSSSGRRMYNAIKHEIKEIYKEFKFDIIHAHTALPDGYAGVLLKNIYNVPLVVTIHGVDLYKTIYLSRKCRNAIEHVFKHADKIITVSTRLKRIAERELGISSKIITIPNGININETAVFEQKYDPKKHKTIISVSYLIPRKAVDYNLRAVAKLVSKFPDLMYYVVGEGPEMNRLKDMTKMLGFQDNVKFLGLLPRNQVYTQIAKADIFSLPSWNEAFGVVYIEAMALAKPVIACKGEGIEDIIRHGENGLLVEPKNVDSLVEALDFLLSNPTKAKIMGEKAQALVLNKYTWGNNAAKTIEIYHEVKNKN